MDRATLLHVAMVNSHPVRFYKAPRDDSQYPWHDHEALLVAGGFNLNNGAQVIPDSIWKEPHLIMRVICPATGRPVAIADNRLAREFFNSAPLGMPLISRGFGEYRDALAEAVGLLIGAMRDPEDRSVWLSNAWLRDQGEQPMPPTMETELRKMTRATGRTLFDPGDGNGLPAGTRSAIH
ncbi:hypothetical protein [Nguyenibacter vanlangensis]|uniref:Uncharacterized protein n=1 Tax=Nguyenibacter vanlangensis TaxID=1216886 RepID=A0A7Y7M492_9PROT|nr:hypothetical protein [Nguyenibacter vanlangensis]NVN09742.1 hypothetical protein [Nguyenibacter vanlangensis]